MTLEINKVIMTGAREFVSDLAEHISMPCVYRQLRDKIADPEARIDDFAEIIARDSMLAVRVIRIARSEFFGFPRQTRDLQQAISLIGALQLHDVLLSCLGMRAFSTLPGQIINLNAFWEYSVQCGMAARMIAQQGGFMASNQFFTLGLLHEIGHAAMFVKAAETSLQIHVARQAEKGSIVELERQALGFDYTEVGAEIVKLWQLPEAYRQVAAFHLRPELADPDYRPAVEVVHLAHCLCQNPTAGAHRHLIADKCANIPQLKNLPGDIDEMVYRDIAANTGPVLGLLWPNGSQTLPADGMSVQ